MADHLEQVLYQVFGVLITQVGILGHHPGQDGRHFVRDAGID
jgi:hypothetical protein